MKKIFYMLLAAVMCFGFASCGDNEKAEEEVALADQLASSYTGKLVVTINGESTEPSTESVSITRVDDTHINFALNNFKLVSDGEQMPVGTIELKGLELTKGSNTLVNFAMQKNITIANGTPADAGWIGPMIGEVPVKLSGSGNKSTMDIDIDIDMQSSLGQTIHVDFVAGK